MKMKEEEEYIPVNIETARFLSEQGKIKQFNKIIDKVNKEITEAAWYGRYNCSISFYDYEIEKSYLLTIEKKMEEMGYNINFRAVKASEEVFLLELNISWEKEQGNDNDNQ